MVSKSFDDLILGSDAGLDLPRAVRTHPREMTVPGISDCPGGESSTEASDTPSTINQDQKIIVANFLPLGSKKDKKTGQWCFAWDKDSLLLQLKDGFSSETEVIYVGSLKVDIDISEQDEVARKLLEDYRCIPTFLSSDLQTNFYDGFCKQQLCPLFHHKLPTFDKFKFKAYTSANMIFADKVIEAMNSDDDYVWVHDYHLMLVPTFIRKRLHRVKLGFFLHSPFPSSEIFMALPVREEILKALLNADGFNTFDYARHFLTCCSRLLGLNYETERGYIGLEYFGRTVSIKILPAGVHIGRLESVLNSPSTITKVQEIEQKYMGKKLFLGVDHMDVFKGIGLKLLGLELLFQKNPKLKGEIVLIQIANPPMNVEDDVRKARLKAISIAERINLLYSGSGYEAVVFIDHLIPFYEKVAFYVAAECCIVNSVMDGMNLVPYEYTVCRQGTEEMSKGRGISPAVPCRSTLIVSEFVGSSRSLSGAFRVNPWSVEDVADAFLHAYRLSDSQRRLRHEKHYQYVSSHDVAYWARSFTQDLERACRDHHNRIYSGIGLGLGFRVLALSPSFQRLSIDDVVSSYKRTYRRAIFLDYDGTLVPETTIDVTPDPKIILILKNLCSNPNNTVFIVSGRGQNFLSEWFSSCENLGIAAEHGYFIRWSKASEWESASVAVNFDWKMLAEPVMRLYTEATDGSYIESKESALVWNHKDAVFNFGSFQAKELLDHLESVLANEPVVVKRGQHIVEVKPLGVSKGLVVEKILGTLMNRGKSPDFVMCIGDDRSDEDMFESIYSTTYSDLFPAAPEVFTCTVGKKPSKAKYYVDDSFEVIRLLQELAAVSIQDLKMLTTMSSLKGRLMR